MEQPGKVYREVKINKVMIIYLFVWKESLVSFFLSDWGQFDSLGGFFFSILILNPESIKTKK